MKFTWITDIHLDSAYQDVKEAFYNAVRDHEGEIVLLTGDIASASVPEDTVYYIKEMAERFGKPIYYVLGNHDYYHAESIESVRLNLKMLPLQAHFLDGIEMLPLGSGVYICGIDGWADGEHGNMLDSSVRMNDHRLIKELNVPFHRWELQDTNWRARETRVRMRILAQRDAESIQIGISRLKELPDAKTVIILTHVPPYPENSLHEGKIAGNDYLPFYTNRRMGDVLRKAAKTYPHIQFEVFCGHAHHIAYFSPWKNLRVRTGEAVYGKPQIQKPTSVDDWIGSYKL